LLAAILNVPEDLGHIIYLTPKSAFGRLETFENIVEYLLIEGSKGATHLEAIAKRAKAILGKRHRIIHGCWGITDGEVSVYDTPLKDDSKPEPFSAEALQKIVSDIRDLVNEIAPTIKAIRIYHYNELQSKNPSPAAPSSTAKD
jgi:hypothetical protein